jgi:rod shape-determining protein MreD
MKWLLVAPATYLVFALQTSLADSLTVAGCVPNLPLAGLLLMAGHGTGWRGLVMAAVWGLIADCLADGRLGPDLICCTICLLVFEHGHAQWNLGSPWRLVAISIPLVLFESAATGAMRALLDGHAIDWQRLCLFAAGSSVWTVVVVAGLAFVGALVGRRAGTEGIEAAPAISNRWRMLTE